MCPAFSLTDYKVQGSTLKTAVLDLKNDPSARGQDKHKKFCSMYVQLSRLRSLSGLHLLQRIDMSDLEFRPHEGLVAEMERLHELEQETIVSWARQGHFSNDYLIGQRHVGQCLYYVSVIYGSYKPP